MIRIPVAVVLLSAAALIGGSRGGSATETCQFRESEGRWIQRALDGWDLVRSELRLEPAPLPWIVLFDASCIWHIQARDPRLVADATPLETALTYDGRTLDIRTIQHAGTVLLPNRVEIPVEVRALSALYRSGRATFLAMSMPPLWRADRAHARNPHLEEYLLGVFAHEMTHTRHLVPINRRLRQLTGTGEIPARLNDDIIQQRFGKAPGFARAVEVERDMYFRAAAERDPVKRQHLAGAALILRRERHQKYFTGAHGAYGEIETLFLTLEGSGQWAAYNLATAQGPFAGREADVQKLVRDNRRFWSQDAGLGVFLLLDALVPGWQAEIFAPEPASPFELIERAIGGDGGNGGGHGGTEVAETERRSRGLRGDGGTGDGNRAGVRA